MIKPKKLKRGDTVGVVAPASPPNQEDLQKAIQYIESLGLRVKIGDHLNKQHGYLAGNDEERVADLHKMFADSEVKAIISACGGYGTGRIAASLDYDLIQRNPKIFWGYSDLTFLHMAIQQKSRLVTFHGPMLASDMGKAEWNRLSDQYFQQLFSTECVIYDEQIAPIETPIKGIATGEVVGGNLCLIVSSLGTPFEIQTKGKLLLIEDIHEEPRSIDRLLNQLLTAGKLSGINGLLVGDFKDCESAKSVHTFTLEEVLQHYIHIINKPTLKGLKMGHCSPHIGIPLGVMGEIRTEEKKLIIESGVV